MLSTRSRLKVLAEIAQEEQLANVVEEKAARDAKRERRRKKIIKELLETEETYLHRLELVHRYFDFPLRFACIIPEMVHSRLFSNIEQIQTVNTQLLEQMEQSTVGQAFLYLGPFLKLYSMYANNHNLALATLQEWTQKNEEFADFVCKQEERLELSGLKLNALLIAPVQRVPRYKLLLEDLLEHTLPSHHDYHALQEATKQVSEIASHINEHVRQHENFQKMLSIQNCLDSTAPKILIPGREFIKEGPLKKVSRKGGKSQDRMFFLFSDMLLYAKPKFLDSGHHSYSCCCVLPLRHCSVERVFTDNRQLEGGGMFKVSCKDEILLLYSLDQDNAKSWMDTLEVAIRKISENRQTLRKPSSNKVPLRGRTLLQHKKQEIKEDPLHLHCEQLVKEKDTAVLSPMDDSSVCLMTETDTNCVTPSKKKRRDLGDAFAYTEPVHDLMYSSSSFSLIESTDLDLSWNLAEKIMHFDNDTPPEMARPWLSYQVMTPDFQRSIPASVKSKKRDKEKQRQVGAFQLGHIFHLKNKCVLQ